VVFRVEGVEVLFGIFWSELSSGGDTVIDD
jgi:hypothetical protein